MRAVTTTLDTDAPRTVEADSTVRCPTPRRYTAAEKQYPD